MAELTRLVNSSSFKDAVGGEIGAVLADGDERGILRHLVACGSQRFEQECALLADAAHQRPGIDLDLRGGLGGAHGALGRGWSPSREVEGRRHTGRRADGVAGPFDGAIRPVRHGPGLDRHGLAGGGFELQRIGFVQLALGPGNAPGDALPGARRRAIEPVQRHGLGGQRKRARQRGKK